MKSKAKGKKKENRLASAGVVVARTNNDTGARAPQVKYTPDGNCSISHMEYVGDIVSGSGKAVSYPCNPQLPLMFTWLSAIAGRFEMYKFTKLKFIYKTSCPTTTAGFVVLAFDFDIYDNAPSKATMLTWKYASKSAVWQDCSLNVTPDSRLSTYRYCNSASPSGGDKRLDFIGNLWVEVGGNAAGLYTGEVYVDYTVSFRQPSYREPFPFYATYDQPTWNVPNDWFDGNDVKITGNIPVIVNTAAKLIIKAAGQYLINIVQGGTGIGGSPSLTITTPIEYPDAEYDYQYLGGVANALDSYALYAVQVLTAGALLTFTQGAGTVTRSVVRVSTYKA